MNHSFSPSWIMLVPIGIAVLVFGLLGLKLIAVIFNALIGQRRPHHMAQQRSSSGIGVGLFAGASLMALIVGVGFLGYARTGMVVRSQQSLVEQERADVAVALREAMHDLAEAREEIQEAVQEAGTTIPVELTEVITGGDGTPGTVATNGTEVATADNSPEPPVDPVADEQVTTRTETETASTAETPSVDPQMKARSEQLAQLATTIGQLVRSRMDKTGEKESADLSDPTAKHADSDVVVFQLSEELVQQLLGDSGRRLLQSFNSELPDSIRQTYALIPLTPPVGGAVSQVQPLLAASGLESIANSLVSLVDIAGPVPESQPGEPSSVVLATAPELRPMPDWVRNPDGRRIVAETEPILPGDDAKRPLTGAINRALADHMASVTQSVHPALREQARFVKLELSDKAARKCVVDTYERIEPLQTAEGTKSIRKMYALLEFPEAVDNAAIREIRRSVQRDRIAGLGIVIGCAWLSIASAGFGIRLWRKGTRLRRWSSVPVFAVVALPLLAVAAGTILTLSQGETVRPPWNQIQDTVRIDLLDAV